jgi:hypothetical protein
VLRDEPTWNLTDKIDCGRVAALKIAAELALYQGRPADYTAAAQVTFRREMDFALSANCSAEAGRDLVILKIDVRTASRADARLGGPADFLLRLALEAFDNGVALSRPKAFKLTKKRCALYRDRFGLREKLLF